MADFMLNVFRKVLKLRGFVKGSKNYRERRKNLQRRMKSFGILFIILEMFY